MVLRYALLLFRIPMLVDDADTVNSMTRRAIRSASTRATLMIALLCRLFLSMVRVLALLHLLSQVHRFLKPQFFPRKFRTCPALLNLDPQLVAVSHDLRVSPSPLVLKDRVDQFHVLAVFVQQSPAVQMESASTTGLVEIGASDARLVILAARFLRLLWLLVQSSWRLGSMVLRAR